MYNNGDPKKEVAKADATRVNIVREDIPLPPSDNLFNYKESAAEMSGGLSGNYKKTITPLPKSYYTMNKTKTSIKRAKRKQ